MWVFSRYSCFLTEKRQAAWVNCGDCEWLFVSMCQLRDMLVTWVYPSSRPNLSWDWGDLNYSELSKSALIHFAFACFNTATNINSSFKIVHLVLANTNDEAKFCGTKDPNRMQSRETRGDAV